MKHFHLRPLQELLNIVFPRHCCSCGQILVGDEKLLCTHCLLHLPYTHNAAVPYNETEQLFLFNPTVKAAASLLYFHQNTATRNIVHSIKYNGNRKLAVVMGRMIGETLAHSGRFDPIDVILPVPLHRRRERARGYNQSALLCQGIAQVLKRPVSTGNLIRTVNTESQTHMNPSERIQNVKGVFAVRRPEQLTGRHVLLVDDVITTGSTTAACCEALNTVDNIHISIFSLALASNGTNHLMESGHILQKNV